MTPKQLRDVAHIMMGNDGKAVGSSVGLVVQGTVLDHVNVIAMEDAFRDWRADNSHALSLDGAGDVVSLYFALATAASQKS